MRRAKRNAAECAFWVASSRYNTYSSSRTGKRRMGVLDVKLLKLTSLHGCAKGCVQDIRKIITQ